MPGFERSRDPARGSTFRIVHLSDLHLTATDDVPRSEPKLFGALRGMNAAFRAIVRAKPVRTADLVLVTGDVTDRGDLESWKVFWNAIDDAGLRGRILVIPGNHDVCSLGLRLPTGRTGYTRADLERALRGLRLGDQPTKFPWARRVDPRIAVFALDSNNLGNLSVATNAMGELGYFQLESFARLLRRHQDAPIKIVALHHSPNIPDGTTARRRNLPKMGPLATVGHQIPRDQRSALRLLCVSQGVRLIVHGHLHRREDRRVSGIRIIGLPATTQPIRSRKLSADYELATYLVRDDPPKITIRWTTIRC